MKITYDLVSFYVKNLWNLGYLDTYTLLDNTTTDDDIVVFDYSSEYLLMNDSFISIEVINTRTQGSFKVDALVEDILYDPLKKTQKSLASVMNLTKKILTYVKIYCLMMFDLFHQ